MNREACDTPLRKQVMGLPELVDPQLERCFAAVEGSSFPDKQTADGIERIFLMGCGDSLASCGAMAGTLAKLSGVSRVRTFDPMEFTRFTMQPAFGAPGSTLFVAVSARGLTVRIREALEKARMAGAHTLLVTGDKESRAARGAEYLLWVNTPPTDYQASPGLRSYFAGMLGVFAAGCRLGQLRGSLDEEQISRMRGEVSAYLHSCAAPLEEMDQHLFEIAERWKEMDKFDFVGSGRALQSALFGAEKFYESSGVVCGWDDSENWCHVNRFAKNPQKIGLVSIIHAGSAAQTRELEMIRCACEAGRKVLVVCCGTVQGIDSRADVVELPAAPDAARWLTSLVDYGPASILAGYHSVLSGRRKVYTKGENGEMQANDPAYLKYMDPALKTQHNSRLEIVY